MLLSIIVVLLRFFGLRSRHVSAGWQVGLGCVGSALIILICFPFLEIDLVLKFLLQPILFVHLTRFCLHVFYILGIANVAIKSTLGSFLAFLEKFTVFGGKEEWDLRYSVAFAGLGLV